LTDTLRHVARLGVQACREGRAAEGIQHLQRCLAGYPDDPQLLKIAVFCYVHVGLMQEALRLAQHWAAVAKASDAYAMLARLHHENLEIPQAIGAYERAIDLEPNLAEAHFGRAELLLLSGRMREGWESYEWRFKMKKAAGMLPKLDCPQWDGRPLPPGKLLLIADQGHGDCVQFVRLLPWASNRAPAPVVLTTKPFEPIVRQFGGLSLITSDQRAIGGAQAYIPLSGLPRLAGIDLDRIPCAEGYLAPSPARLEHWRRKLDRLISRGRRRIAIVWAGQPRHANDSRRSLKLREFVRPFADADAVLISVQKGPQVAEVGGYLGATPLINLGPEILDFTDTLAILKNVERLITVDTSVAHLAGAAGIPASVALPYTPDWRWLLDREDSPWYRSVKLYRQRRRGDWPDVMQRIAADLDR